MCWEDVVRCDIFYIFICIYIEKKDWKQPGCPLVGLGKFAGVVYSLEDTPGVRNKEEGFDKRRSPRYGRCRTVPVVPPLVLRHS